jgi:hypothetical protein
VPLLEKIRTNSLPLACPINPRMKKLTYILLITMLSCNSETKVDNPALGTNAEITLKTEITCPNCGHKAAETMPTDVCLIKYTCKECKADMFPKEGDCCVFCTYGDHKCPPKQEETYNLNPRVTE